MNPFNQLPKAAASKSLRTGVATLMLVCWVLPSSTLAASPITGAKPLAPQPSASAIKPGLAVTYYYAMFEHVRDIPHLVSGTPGEPIPVLDHDTDTGRVLTGKRAMGVGAEIRGLIRFPEPGTYVFRVNSNDGVKVQIAGLLVHEDPWIHPDTLSDPIPFTIDTAGWYPLSIDYYQKKGTSALGLYWTPPGEDKEVAVPAEFYGHLE
ncbi:PA14 domain-containing protein [Motiliproteus sp. SC1-56]|uniref:PA14 domain-containing protein n=1 Tax=Motiliproteus sp. SC1-56 TaxID=2799565 RepID=UPI001A8D6B8B|nr:PA14 domain-containing protein [Motiliproteus sp. SC1-56]